MIKIALLFASLLPLINNSIYDLQISTIDGNVVNLSDFANKKILFVNTATNSQYVNQYAALEQLQQQYQDSLVIIAFPSNSFGNEPENDTTIKDFVMNTYNVHFILAAKTSVKDSTISPLYQWLTQQSENGVLDNPVDGDFFKYLVNEEGRLIGVFDGSVDPLSDLVQSALQN